MGVNALCTEVQLCPAAQDTVALRQVFQSIDASSCPYRFNFHMHTVCSDGQLEPEELMEQAIAIGLSGLAITDHHTVSGYYRAQQWLNEYDCPDDSARPQLWTGVEISADLLGTEV
ncbi:MAG: PHP domain-containing protein, partial [Cyanobacteria bacterium]|nr:PHP domain-containing protein [Cyanobacteriota bacterium]MDW8203040.1 PHP domain-containing protein [Cyanobacteriota bacterium SKYGB_h_bin112]